MKKLFTFLIIVLNIMIVNAQIVNKGGGTINSKPFDKPSLKVSSSNKAVGDTLLYCDGFRWFVNATDIASFMDTTEDLDQKVTHNAGYFMAFGTFYDTTGRVDWWMPWDVDTAFYKAATSWFDPEECCADNWLEFGPITLPPGSELSWWQRYNGSGGTPPYWFDGYEVLISKTGLYNYGNFVDPPVFVRTDTNTYDGTDSSWAMKTVTIPATYASTPCWFAFHHNADNMDVLYLDEIKIIVTIDFGLDEISTGISQVQNVPNPANDQTVISYMLNNSGNVSLQVNDITGRVVFSRNLGVQSSGSNQVTLNTSDFSSGLYYYTLNVNNNRIVRKMTIAR